MTNSADTVPASVDPGVPPRGPKALMSIQYLRGVAALGVVAWHAQSQMGLGETQVLQAGIEVFFIVSGYVMWLILSERPVSPATFLRKRITRVVPLYWTLTTVILVMLLVAPGMLQSTRFDPVHTIMSYLFLPWPNPVAESGLKPLMIPGWTLNYEMFFYALLAAALALPARWRAGFTVGTLSLLGAMSLLPLGPIAHFYASPFMIEFVLGIGLAMVLPRLPLAVRRLGRWSFGLGLILLLAVGSAPGAEQFRLVTFAIPATLIVGGLVAWEETGGLPRLSLLKMLGDASYPLYMLHPILLSAMAQAWRAFGATDLSPWVYVLVSLIVASGVGYLAHVMLERPLIKMFQRPPRRPSAAGAAAAQGTRP